MALEVSQWCVCRLFLSYCWRALGLSPPTVKWEREVAPCKPTCVGRELDRCSQITNTHLNIAVCACLCAWRSQAVVWSKTREPASSRYVMRNHIKIHFGTGQGRRGLAHGLFCRRRPPAPLHPVLLLLFLLICPMSCSPHHHHNHSFPPSPLLVTSKGKVLCLALSVHSSVGSLWFTLCYA